MNLLKNQQTAETIDSVYIDLEAQLMQNIARHLSDWGNPIDTDKWLMQKLAEIGKLNNENIKAIAKASGISQTAAERMLNALAEEAIQSLEPGFRHLVREGLVDAAVDVRKSKNVRQTMKSLKDQAKDALNLTNTTMLHKAQETFKNLAMNTSALALEIMNNNTAGMITGAESRQQALRRTIRQFNENGITGFVDKRGRNWTPEAYVNMAMRTTSGQVADQIQEARCNDYGINLISIDAHSGARPKCAKDQGKIFDMNNGSGTTEDLNGRKIKYYPWNSSSYGEPDGLLGINCGHHRFPFIPGVNIQRYFPTDDLDANNELYRQTQVQRALERDVRKQKRECMLYDELGDKDAFEEAAVKLKAKEARLRDYVNKHDNLHRRRDREQVVGFDKRISAEAIRADKRKVKEREGVVDESRITQKNQKAAENWAKKHLGIKKTNYTKQPVKVVNNVNRALQRIYRDNPILQDFVDEIEFKDVGAVAQASIVVKGGKITTKLTFSPSQCIDEKQIQQMINKQVASKFWTNKKGLYGIAKHETTHLCEYALAFKRYGVDKATGAGDIAGAIKAIKSHEIATEIQKKALKNCNMKYDYDTIKEKLGVYAYQGGAGEFLAEACSEYKPRKLAKEVQKLFEEEMKK